MKLGLNNIISEMKEGLNPSKISKKYNISKQTLDYSLSKLKKLGCIEKAGYGTWNVIKEVPKVPKGSIKGDSDLKEIRGHAFIWKIEFTSPYDWNRIIRYYRKKKLNFSLVCNGKVPRTIFNNRKIWFTKKGLIIYEPLDFMGKSSFEVKGTAVFEMDRLIKDLLKEMNIKFKPYRFSTSREHYGMVKNELARQYNNNKEKMLIKSEDGSTWLWIDDSKGLGELETQEPHISRKVQNFWNSHKKNNFKTDSDFILKNFKESAKQIKKNAKNLDYYGENMASHVRLMKSIDKNLSKQTKFFEEMKEYFSKK